MTKIAYGCDSLDYLRERLMARTENGTVTLTTRYKPKRADELVGGSLYWILHHKLVARQRIVGFEEAEGGRCLIRLNAELVSVMPRPRRAHQGWRYLEAGDAPKDLDQAMMDAEAIPPHLIQELSGLGLL
jgi:hypothetical protein